MVPDVSKIFEDRQPVWVLLAVCYLSDCPVMRFGPAFAFSQAKCDHGLPPSSVHFLLPGVSTAFVVEAPDEGWEPRDSGVSS